MFKKRLVDAPIKPGIPLSSVFKAEGADRVFAAMNDEEKAHHSHRGRAFELLKQVLVDDFSY